MKSMVMNTILGLLLITALSAVANAQGSGEAASSKGSDKVDLKKLEDKYWSAKDDDYAVIQNRTFSKKGKFYGSLVYGPLINDPFAVGRASGGMLGYHFSEDFGVELSYLGYDSKPNDTVQAYKNQFGGVMPDYNLVKSAMTVSGTYTPFYAKMAFMNKSILYFDMGFTLGLGMTNYEIQKVNTSATNVDSAANEMAQGQHVEIGVMQQLFLNNHFAFRLDIKNTFYSQKTKQYRTGPAIPESARTSGTKSTNDTTITFGLTLFTK